MFIYITIWLLAVSMIVMILRAIKGPTVWDRLLALNILSAQTVMLIILYGTYMEDYFLYDIAFVYSVIGFLAVTLITGFIMKGGRQK
jgi:multicomponent Na+:H+ antiporter subunit F